MQWADTRNQMRRNFTCTQREKIDQSGTISAKLGAYVKESEVSFAFWAASLWQLSCSLLSGFITFCDYWKFHTAKIFKFLIKNKKAIQWTKLVSTKLSTICNLWVIYGKFKKQNLQRNQIYILPEKKLILKNGSKFASQTRRFTVLMLL